MVYSMIHLKLNRSMKHCFSLVQKFYFHDCMNHYKLMATITLLLLGDLEIKIIIIKILYMK